jgi:hypothetical protein
MARRVTIISRAMLELSSFLTWLDHRWPDTLNGGGSDDQLWGGLTGSFDIGSGLVCVERRGFPKLLWKARHAL